MALADLMQGSLWRTPPIFDAPSSGMPAAGFPGQAQEPSPTPQPRWMQMLNSPMSQIAMRLLANSRDQRGNPTPIGQALGNSVLGYQQQVQSQQEEELRRKYMQAQIARMQQPEQAQEPAQIQLLRALQKDPALLEMYQKMNPTGTTQDAAAIQEYRLAQTTGFKGSYMDFIKSKNAPQREPLIAIQTPDGRSVLVPQSQASGATPAAPRENFTPQEGERKAAALGTRLEGAMRELLKLEQDKPGATSPGFGESIAGKIPFVGDVASNAARSPQRQQARAAQLDALDAALTLATGAAYTKEQLENLWSSYFPQLLDDEETKAAKKRRFETIVETARIAAGRAEPSINKALGGSKSTANTPEDPLGIR